MTDNLDNERHYPSYSVIDITAPLIPGQNAASIMLGSPIEILKNDVKMFILESGINSIDQSIELFRYCSNDVDIWTKNGAIDQIMVHGSYSGKLMGSIGIGSTISDIERTIGVCEEDEYDNFIILNVPGICFEIEGYFPGLVDPMYRFAPIKEIYIYLYGNE